MSTGRVSIALGGELYRNVDAEFLRNKLAYIQRRERELTKIELLRRRLKDAKKARENEEEPDRLAKELSRINTQLAIRNHRMRRVLKIIAVALLVFVALIFAIMALNYAPMPQSKYTKRDARNGPESRVHAKLFEIIETKKESEGT